MQACAGGGGGAAAAAAAAAAEKLCGVKVYCLPLSSVFVSNLFEPVCSSRFKASKTHVLAPPLPLQGANRRHRILRGGVHACHLPVQIMLSVWGSHDNTPSHSRHSPSSLCLTLCLPCTPSPSPSSGPHPNTQLHLHARTHARTHASRQRQDEHASRCTTAHKKNAGMHLQTLRSCVRALEWGSRWLQ